ncbi:MAG: iron dicitrate transport regulator FecR [Bdellovibrio sp. CG12_big_fil_rev_8_21_14_0_65_39_13]|nr:MAG: iron dicitrate transport regulator FecR [Bdellovibrio sp. CG22_combo_CG10-13_8_21_14_all_39_27]PIQ61346.1 MAG: iron dicitrate transport regulator FecR [Bdellovibrio sp. CG12_big_fil_rev_8_21_14_0_65_39_13]PIR36708.1 MAG: iron dicitrate transport regulator FecR [Bdellovibrio sp. CG11_big_fil_rev_8_21_14_0_20_39_38]
MTSLMRQEALETPAALIRQWNENDQLRREIALEWRDFSPYSFVTLARGSSDHAAQYLNYLVSLKLKKMGTSLPPSILTLHQTVLDLSQSVCVAISQSGKSPDLIQPFEFFKKSHFETLAMVNVEDSPLARAAKYCYPLKAGPELSVAATKSFIASLYASASLIAEMDLDRQLSSSLEALPEKLILSQNEKWNQLITNLNKSARAMIVGRGLGFSIALEAALKLKETCNIQAEAFSAAEIKHGPQAIIEHGYPLIIFALKGPTQLGMVELAKEMRQRGAQVFLIADQSIPDRDGTYHTTDHEYLEPISCIQSFYLMAEELAISRGLDPDRPRSLSKVTMTL